MMQDPVPEALLQPGNLPSLDIFRCYQDSKYLSVKHSSYFQVYDELLSKYKNRPITFVEIGVLNGGSLFMWRKFFGPDARIIGIDINPVARRWAADGFEIYIGSQSDGAFWDNFFSSVGDVDVVLDDGGHTNEQQIITAQKCIPHIKDNGMLVVEDVHASYLPSFGNPSKYSFINYVKFLIDGVNSRFPLVSISANPLNKIVYSICIFESIVCFNIARGKCFVSSPTSNNAASANVEDLRHQDSGIGKVGTAKKILATRLKFLEKFPPAIRASKAVLTTMYYIYYRTRSRRLKKYFS